MKKILYLEDDPINAFVMERLLRKDFLITHVTNGESCLELIQKEAFHCILMDINLGKGNMNGIETMKRIKEINSFKDIPVFAITSYAMPEDKERFLSDGFDYYLPKPVERKILVQQINRFCR